jgi:hypothetical protein
MRRIPRPKNSSTSKKERPKINGLIFFTAVAALRPWFSSTRSPAAVSSARCSTSVLSFKGPGFAQGESFFVDAGTGQILFASSPEKVGTSFSAPGDMWREGVLQDIRNKTPGSKSTAQTAAVFSPLGIGSFGLVQTIPMNVAGAGATQKSGAAGGLTLERAAQNPEALLLNPVVLVLLAALGWVLVVGFILRASFLKPIEAAQKLLEAVVSGKTKVSEEALKKVGAHEVQSLVRTSTQWADRLEREKEDLSRRREEDAHRAAGQLKQRGQELADTVQKLNALKAEVDQKDQAVSSKQQELEALKGMGEGLRNQAEQARGEVAKLKTQMSNLDLEAKQRDTTYRQQLDQQTVQANEQLKESGIQAHPSGRGGQLHHGFTRACGGHQDHGRRTQDHLGHHQGVRLFRLGKRAKRHH